jgi:hypothetical protein
VVAHQDDPPQDAKADGFAGFVAKGQEFELWLVEMRLRFGLVLLESALFELLQEIIFLCPSAFKDFV